MEAETSASSGSHSHSLIFSPLKTSSSVEVDTSIKAVQESLPSPIACKGDINFFSDVGHAAPAIAAAKHRADTSDTALLEGTQGTWVGASVHVGWRFHTLTFCFGQLSNEPLPRRGPQPTAPHPPIQAQADIKTPVYLCAC